MSNVYLVKFETVRAFSTARKAVEHVQANYDGGLFEAGYLEDGAEFEIQNQNTAKLISRLNKGEVLLVDLGGFDQVEVLKATVQ